jgi:hypothetical protein
VKTARVRIIKHEAVPECGSFEVRYPDDRPSQYFYWDDISARRMRPETLDRETALEKAKAVARAALIANRNLGVNRDLMDADYRAIEASNVTAGNRGQTH